jgi:creatinase
MIMSITNTSRPQTLTLHNGEKTPLPFSASEYQRRIDALHQWMEQQDIPVVVLTSMHNIAYYSGFLYCAFGRPYGCVITADKCTTVSANIDYGQPWRNSIADNVVYTDWRRDNYYRAIRELAGNARRIGIEQDHLTLMASKLFDEFLGSPEMI